MPLKRAVLPLLDRAEPAGGQVGGANTVIFGGAGRQGFNTDVPGMITTLAPVGRRAAPDALILGAGATACAALAALHGIGTRQAAVAVRDPATAGPLLAVADRLGLTARLVPFGADPGERARDLLISTVPAGAADIYAERIASADSRPPRRRGRGVSPVAHPAGRRGRQAGVAVAGGFELLLHQATGQVELMTGRDAPVAAMRAAGLAALARR